MPFIFPDIPWGQSPCKYCKQSPASLSLWLSFTVFHRKGSPDLIIGGGGGSGLGCGTSPAALPAATASPSGAAVLPAHREGRPDITAEDGNLTGCGSWTAGSALTSSTSASGIFSKPWTGGSLFLPAVGLVPPEVVIRA